MRFLSALFRRLTEHRGIFVYWDGRKYRRIDPLAAYRGLATHSEFDWEATPRMLEVPDEREVLLASQLLAQAMRDVFRLPPVEQGGLTERECRVLLGKFVKFCGRVKKNTATSPKSPTSTVCPTDDSATKSSSDSGSTVPDRDTGTPGTPDRESSGHSEPSP